MFTLFIWEYTRLCGIARCKSLWLRDDDSAAGSVVLGTEAEPTREENTWATLPWSSGPPCSRPFQDFIFYFLLFSAGD